MLVHIDANLFAAANIVLLRLDRRGVVTFALGAVESTSGWRPETIVGKHFTDLVVPEHGPAVLERFREQLAGKADVDCGAVVVLDRNGRRLGLRIGSRAVRENGEVTGVEVIGYPCPLRQRTAIRRRATRAGVHLTPRQLQVLRLLGEGLSTKAIAARLTISEETARNHIRRILRELGCHSRLEAVVRAHKLNLI